MDLVTYKNEMNTLHFHGFSAVDLDMLMTLCSRMKDRDEDVMEFEFAYLKKIMEYKAKDNDRFISDLDAMNSKLIKVTASFKTDTKKVMFVLFPTFEIDTQKETLKVRVNPDFKYLLNKISGDFTLFELQEFVSLSGKYSKNLYRLLKQFRKTGTYVIDLENFRRRMDIPDTYKNRDVLEKAIKPAVEELTRLCYFKDLKVEPETARKKGAPVTGYTFTFRKSNQIAGQESFHDADSFNSYTKSAGLKSKKGNRFNQFEQQNYNIAELEERILSN